MDQRERLAICNNCINRKLDYEQGYVCQLTGRFADFEGTCKHYVLDHTVIDTIKVRTKDRPFVPLFDPVPPKEDSETKKKAAPRKAAPKTTSQKKQASKVALKKLRRYQSFLYALIGGLLITATAAVGWALITEMTGYQGVYLALGVGVLVGIAVRFFGAGIKRIFGILAALLALTGSLLGYYLSQNGFLEELQLARIVSITDYLDQELMLNTMRDSFVPLDLAFYGLAVLLAYFIAIRRINSKKMARLEQDGYKGAPALYWLRLPLILAGILLKLGTYGLLRFALPLFPHAALAAQPIFVTLALVGILYGALVAWAQVDIKKLVAYSSVAHLGFVVLGLFAFDVVAWQGSLIQMINHGLSTGALFLLVGMLYERRHTKLFAEYGGLAKVMPWFAFFLVFTALASVGLPGLNGFVGEFLILVGSYRGGLVWPTILATVGVILAAVYLLKMLYETLWGPIRKEENRGLTDLSLREILVMTRVKGLTLRETAERMGRSYEAGKKLYGRAFLRLREICTELEGEAEG